MHPDLGVPSPKIEKCESYFALHKFFSFTDLFRQPSKSTKHLPIQKCHYLSFQKDRKAHQTGRCWMCVVGVGLMCVSLCCKGKRRQEMHGEKNLFICTWKILSQPNLHFLVQFLCWIEWGGCLIHQAQILCQKTKNLHILMETGMLQSEFYCVP